MLLPFSLGNAVLAGILVLGGVALVRFPTAAPPVGSAAWGIGAGAVGVALVGTGVLGFCPIYAALGMSTRARS